jgi:response regulator RpfG family c-di-GMP phosphodiesterase
MEDNRIGQMLLREGVLSEADLKRALDMQKEAYGKHLGEILLDQKMLDEATFLRVLAKQYHTQYLTTKKLSELKVPPSVLKLIPETTAEKYNLFPVQYKKNEKSLAIVMVNPDDVAAIDAVKFVSGIGNVKTLIGLAEGVKAAINRWYKNDENAFNLLLGMEVDFTGGYEMSASSAAAPASQLETSDGPLDLEGLVRSTEDEGPKPAPAAAPAPEPPVKDKIILGSNQDDSIFLDGLSEMPGDNSLDRGGIVIEDLTGEEPSEVETITVAPISRVGEGVSEADAEADTEADAESRPTARRPDVKKYRLRMLVVEPNDKIRTFIVKLYRHEGFKVQGVENREQALAELDKEEYDSLVIKDRDLGEGDEFAKLLTEKHPDVELCSLKDYGSAVIGETQAYKRLMSSILETLSVLIGLLEMETGGMQGHGYNIGKFARLIATKLDLPQREVDTIALAGYIHDLGKKGMKHRSVLEIDSATASEELMEQAEIPLKILSAAKFPLKIAPIIRHQYERWDGQGLPDHLKGEEVPVGSRILALVEAFEHLTNKGGDHPAQEPPAALENIKKFAGQIFDPGLVNIFLALVRDEIYLQQMAGDKERILVVDTEVDQITLLELRLVNLGFAVTSARSGAEALDKIKASAPSLIITEVNLPDQSGFDLIEKLKKDPAFDEIPFIFFSKNDDPSAVNRGFNLGAEDYLTKPMKVEILGAKVNLMMSRLKSKRKAAPAATGVTGNLSEMGIPDIVQILSAGRKTGKIAIEGKDKTASIFMVEGQVVNAFIAELKGEEAVYEILRLTEGAFSIDPNAEIPERIINQSVDSLMIEGFRRLDEATRGTGPEDDIQLDGTDTF